MHTIPGSALTALYKKVHTSTSLFKWALLLHTKDHNLFFHCHKAVAHILGPITTFQSLSFPVIELLVPWYQSQTLHATLQPICVTLTLNVTPFFLQDTSVSLALQTAPSFGSSANIITASHFVHQGHQLKYWATSAQVPVWWNLLIISLLPLFLHFMPSLDIAL